MTTQILFAVCVCESHRYQKNDLNTCTKEVLTDVPKEGEMKNIHRKNLWVGSNSLAQETHPYSIQDMFCILQS